MDLSLKNVSIVVVLTGVVGFAFGRYSMPESVKETTDIKQTQEKKEDTKTDVDKDKHYVKTTAETTHTDGTKTTTTTTTVDTSEQKKTDDNKSSDSTKDIHEEKEVIGHKDKINLGLMTGIDVTHGLGVNTVLYGGYINRPLLGPITIGVWGLSNGTAGLSLGLVF